MSTLVVLAIVAAAVGMLGLLLTSRSQHGQQSRGRHGGGSAAAARALVTVLPLLAALGLLFAFRDHTELALAAIALWWACLPWLALTGRLTAWGHATWALAANAAATGLVCLAWLVTSSGLSPLRAVGAWVLWVAAAAAAVLFLAYAREVAGVERGAAGSIRHGRLSPRPALSAMWLVGGAAAVTLALLVQPGSASSPAAAADTADSAPSFGPSDATTSTPSAPATSAPSPTPSATPTNTEAEPAAVTTTAPPQASTTSVSRSHKRTATSTTAPPRTTTTASPTSSTLWSLKILPTPKKKGHTITSTPAQ